MILELWMVGVAIAVLLFIRVPVGLAFIGPFLWYAIADGRSAGFSLKTAFDGLNSFPLLAVPLFILVGVMANRLGIADRLYDFCLASLARVRGNLAYVNVASAVGFSWMSGSALADVAGLGKMQIPQMIRAGYPYGFAAGLTASSSLISPVMPPSIPAVIYAATAAVSTGAMFAASVIPAFIMAFGLCVYIFIWTARRPRSRPGAVRLATARAGDPSGSSARSITPVILLGGILTGLLHPDRGGRGGGGRHAGPGPDLSHRDAEDIAAGAAGDRGHHRRHHVDPRCGGVDRPDPDPGACLPRHRRVPGIRLGQPVGLHDPGQYPAADPRLPDRCHGHHSRDGSGAPPDRDQPTASTRSTSVSS